MVGRGGAEHERPERPSRRPVAIRRAGRTAHGVGHPGTIRAGGRGRAPEASARGKPVAVSTARRSCRRLGTDGHGRGARSNRSVLVPPQHIGSPLQCPRRRSNPFLVPSIAIKALIPAARRDRVVTRQFRAERRGWTGKRTGAACVWVSQGRRRAAGGASASRARTRLSEETTSPPPRGRRRRGGRERPGLAPPPPAQLSFRHRSLQHPAKPGLRLQLRPWQPSGHLDRSACHRIATVRAPWIAGATRSRLA